MGDQVEEEIRGDRSPISSGWGRGNLERVRESTIARIRLNLTIEKEVQQIRPEAAKAGKTGNEAFVVMAFNPDLDEVYEKAILPAITECGLEPYRVDREEFEGTITEAILGKIRTCRVVVADLTHERPNCYYELGYAVASERPYVITARQDHDPRRPDRRPDEPKVHFDLDSHKITYWRTECLPELKQNLIQRIQGILKN
jgi:nucleoside 2-deoxyribosyltransferase